MKRARDPRSRRQSDGGARGERLQKLIAAAGLASRRGAEVLIREGRVRVNGRVVTQLGARADARRDRISVDGRRLGRPARHRHYLLYKPRGVVTTTRDPHVRRPVTDLVPSRERLFPVGRLDAASEGLLLLTNDGELAQVLLHPSFAVPRTYRVSVDGMVRAPVLRRIAQGVEVRGRRTSPCEVKLLAQEEARSSLEITLVQGRRRQIREMMRAVGHPVRRLLRVRFGPLRLRGLAPGESRPLTPTEKRALERMVAQGREQRDGAAR